MNFAQLRAFHAVAGAGGFTRGAARLGVSQPAVTVQVRALEQAYGIELFRRRGHGAELTDFGAEVFRHTRRVFARLDELEQLLTSAGALEVGRLQIGADGPTVVMDLLAAFTARHPGVRVAVRMGNASRVLADLEEGRTDVAVLNLMEASPELHVQELAHDRIVAFVPRGHPWAERPAVTLADLAQGPLVLREPGSATRAMLLAAMQRAGLTPKVSLELSSREAVREAVLAGLGIGTVFTRELAPDPRLIALPIADAELSTANSLACLIDRRQLRTVEAFFGVARGLYPASCRAGGTGTAAVR